MSIITPKSAKSARKAAETLAYYFKREFQYDSIQYYHLESTGKRDRIILLTHSYHDHKAALGIICFRWRDYENAPHGLALAWLWLHPYIRRKGVLAAYWPFFRGAYGDYYVEPPISKAMGEFLAKMGECPRCGTRRVCKQCKESEGS